jgi:hypothetical protein
VTRTRQKLLDERTHLKAEYGELFDSVAELLFRHDPVGINFEINTDEYEPQTATILARLRGCTSADDVRRVVHEEFVRWFDEATAGSEQHYTTLASDIWHLWTSSPVSRTEPGR